MSFKTSLKILVMISALALSFGASASEPSVSIDISTPQQKIEDTQAKLSAAAQQFRQWAIGQLGGYSQSFQPKAAPDRQKDMEDYLAQHDPSIRAVSRKMTGLARQGLSKANIIDLHNLNPAPIISKVVPWSGYWYPKSDHTMYDNSHGQSPLGKYDAVRASVARDLNIPADNKSARDWEEDAYGGATQSDSWEGLCDAWSLASILSPEPTSSVTIDGVTFSTADLRAIIIRSYDRIDPKSIATFGQRYNPDDRDQPATIREDMFPDEFHQLLQYQLGEKHEPFIMDHNPGEEVWNVPVTQAQFSYSLIAGQPNSILVVARVAVGVPLESYNKNDEHPIPTESHYTYLYVLHGTNNNGIFTIQSGEWENNDKMRVYSISQHPDFSTVIVDKAHFKRASSNPNLDPRIVDEILRRSGAKPRL